LEIVRQLGVLRERRVGTIRECEPEDGPLDSVCPIIDTAASAERFDALVETVETESRATR
jgi:hypothetical protein